MSKYANAKVAIVGTGYVGLVSGACFAEMGTRVVCVDIDEKKIADLLSGKMPIYEPGLEELVKRNVREGRLSFSTSLSEVMANGAEIVFCAVGTPPDEDGSADLSHVLSVARAFGENLRHYALFVTKSTVPVGTCDLVRQTIENELKARGEDNLKFDVASNPEFLKEGAAIKDFMSPDRVVIGIDSDHAKELMSRLYRPFLLNNFRVMFMDLHSAEMAKYAANAMLATRISFMNEIAGLCEKVGADVNQVRKAIGADARIGTKFLYAGCGYGGSCFPKDVKALIRTGLDNGCKMDLISAVEQVNDRQKEVVAQKLLDIFDGDVRGRRIALWGLAFKPETDDMRCAPALNTIERLLSGCAEIVVFDPVAMNECMRRFGDKVIYASGMYEAVKDADALALLTEWKMFRLPDWEIVSRLMKGREVIDGRNIYSPGEVISAGLSLHNIGNANQSL